ncbi:MAG: carbohydrate ABC transporter permease [Candidatus Limnocylindria bacterium]
MAAEVVPRATRPAPSRRRRIALEHLQAYLLVLPALLFLGLFDIIPAFAAFAMSLTRWSIVYERFAGLDNYRAILDPGGARFAEFMNSLGVTLWYVAITVPVEMAISLVVAFVLFQRVAGRGAYRTVYFLPYITSVVAAAVVFEWIFDLNYGFLNWVIGTIGIGPQDWLREPEGLFRLVGSAFGVELGGALAGPSLSLVAVGIFTIWHFIGFQVVVFMAGLGNISREYYEAARIDGASERQIFTRITLPLLSPTTFFVLILATIGAMRAFGQIYVLTNGGPLDTTRTVSMLIFRTFFERTGTNGIGLGAAMSFILVLIILAITLVQFRVVGRRVHYE